MGPSADHVEQAGHAVEGVANNNDGFVGIEFAVAHALWEVSLYDPDLIVVLAFSREAHLEELPVQRSS